MRRALLCLACALGLAAAATGCATNAGGEPSAAGARGGSGIEVFGTIDAGVSSVRNRSGR